MYGETFGCEKRKRGTSQLEELLWAHATESEDGGAHKDQCYHSFQDIQISLDWFHLIPDGILNDPFERGFILHKRSSFLL